MWNVQIVIAIGYDREFHSGKDLLHRFKVWLIEIDRFTAVDQQAVAVERSIDQDLVEFADQEIR